MGHAEEAVAAALPAVDERTERARRRLARALGPRSGHVVVTATSAREAAAFLGQLEPAIVAYRRAWLRGDALDAAHLLDALEVRDAPRPPLPLALQRLATQARGLGRPIVVVVTEADRASAAALDGLRLLLEGVPDAPETFRVVLAGGPALVSTLREPQARAFTSRVTTVVDVPRAVTSVVLVETSRLASDPLRPTPRRRWPRPERMLGAALLGSAMTAAVFPLVVPPQAGSQLGVVAGPGIRTAAADMPLAAPAPPEPVPSALPATAAPALDAPAPDAAPPQAVVHPAPAAAARAGSIQVGAFREAARAARLRDDLAGQFDWVMVTEVVRDGVTWHRVRVEGLATRRAVDGALAVLRRAGHRPIVIRY